MVTDGTFGWADDVMTGTAVPDALQGVFSEEPRWVDMRFAKSPFLGEGLDFWYEQYGGGGVNREGVPEDPWFYAEPIPDDQKDIPSRAP